MIFAAIDVNIVTHEKALAAGVEAFGLWSWGMCYSQMHEMNGRLPRVAVLAAMGGRRNIMLARRLEQAGLWTANDDGSWSIYNYAKKNQTSEDIQKKKADAAERVRRWRETRNGSVTRTLRVTGSVIDNVRTDPSPPPPPPPPPDNITREQNERERARGVTLDVTPVPPNGVTPNSVPPTWVAESIEAVELQTGETFDRGVVWVSYQGSREASRREVSAPDFRKFLGAWASNQKRDRVNARDRGGGKRQPLGDPNAPWLKTGSDL